MKIYKRAITRSALLILLSLSLISCQEESVSPTKTQTRSGDPIRFVSSYRTGSTFNIAIGFDEAGMDFAGSGYFYTGTMTGWTAVTIPANDVDNIFDNDRKYVVVRMNLAPGNYEMGVGKYQDGRQVWGTFSGPFVPTDNKTLIRFRVAANGDVYAGW